jgi:hypothetical protein
MYPPVCVLIPIPPNCYFIVTAHFLFPCCISDPAAGKCIPPSAYAFAAFILARFCALSRAFAWPRVSLQPRYLPFVIRIFAHSHQPSTLPRQASGAPDNTVQSTNMSSSGRSQTPSSVVCSSHVIRQELSKEVVNTMLISPRAFVDEKYCDLKITCKTITFNVHRVVVCSACDFFEKSLAFAVGKVRKP